MRLKGNEDTTAQSPHSINSCDTDEGETVLEVITDYVKYCLPDHLCL